MTPVSTPTPPIMDFENPVFPRDFPDPFILPVRDQNDSQAGGQYYGYATNARHMNIQVIGSDDLVHWERVGEKGNALPHLPDWAAPRQFLTWAPGVLQRDDEYILYYVARHTEAGRQCISYAVSDSPEGPFVDPGQHPFICQLDEGGSIDPEPFTDQDGVHYLLWKNDGNCCNLPVWIYAQRLSDDGRTLVGEPQRLITRDQAWEEPLIENPSMHYHQGAYHLIYSANRWDGGDYAVGYARCESPLGPCVKPQDGPIMASIGRTVGPGGASFFTDYNNNVWIAYHAWTIPKVGYPVGQRRLHLARVAFAGDQILVYRPEADE